MPELLTERDVLRARNEGIPLAVPPGAIVTPAAWEAARAFRVAMIPSPGGPERARGDASRTVALAADHAGFPLKESLKPFVESLGFHVVDLGTFSTESVDYPDFAFAVAQAVLNGICQYGIVVDAGGVGSSMAANKVPGIRAAFCPSVFEAKNSREHNNANVLALGSRAVDPEKSKQIVKTWLETTFAGGRHARRVEKIMEIETRYVKGALSQ